MARVTVANLKAEIKDINKELCESGSDYRYCYHPRNGAHAVDLKHSDAAGGKVCSMACGYEPPALLIEQLRDGYDYYLGLKRK